MLKGLVVCVSLCFIIGVFGPWLPHLQCVYNKCSTPTLRALKITLTLGSPSASMWHGSSVQERNPTGSRMSIND